MNKVLAGLLAGLLVVVLGLGLTQSAAPRTELVSYAMLPADTFAQRPAAGRFNADGSRIASAPLPGQPVQGFSARNLKALPAGKEAPEVVHMVIEIPRGSANKYEYYPDLGVIRLDRVLPTAQFYPGDYGFIPSSLGGDGDPSTA